MITKAEFMKLPHLGIFCIANDEICLVPLNCPKELEEAVNEHLKVDVVKTSMARTSLLGIFAAMNNKLIIVPDLLEKEEMKTLKDVMPEVLVLEARHTAVGNLVAMNDHGIVCSRVMQKSINDSFPIKIADSDLVGSAMFVTNRGFLAHREASDEEVQRLSQALKVKGDIGTVNMGDPFVKSGLIGNKNGIIAGARTSGPELNRIEDIFLFSE